ncbi:MAG: L,D-transpeptidase family protein [Actinomycetota bacterium]|nr:L,D-transpeptidase family protein [Actinomycetota bacterium]
MGLRDRRFGRGSGPALLAATVVCTVGLSACGPHHRPLARPVAPATTTIPPAPQVTLPVAPAGSTLVATTAGTVPASPWPEAPQTGTLPATWYGYPTVLPVIDESPGWVRVRLAQRPNQASAWVPAADVSLTSTPYRIVINVASNRLQVFQSGTQILDLPAGVGTSDDPTVTGHYFMTMRVAAPSPGYGPFVLVTSAHSDSITDWEGSGDAIIAIHGPIDERSDSQIGSTGAKISHGCVRLHDADLARLSVIPPGTPIDIVAGT